MGVSLSKLVSNTATTTVLFETGDIVTVVYYPNRITSKMMIQAQEVERTNDPVLSVKMASTILSTVIKSWDLFVDDKHKTMYPLDEEKLQDLPVEVTSKVVEAIVKDMNPEAFAAKVK